MEMILNTKDTKDSKEEQDAVSQAFPLVTFVYFVFRNVFPLKTVIAKR
jgi:hypothetical protein